MLDRKFVDSIFRVLFLGLTCLSLSACLFNDNEDLGDFLSDDFEIPAVIAVLNATSSLDASIDADSSGAASYTETVLLLNCITNNVLASCNLLDQDSDSDFDDSDTFSLVSAAGTQGAASSDFNGDDHLNSLDLDALAACYLLTTGGNPGCTPMDLDGSGTVDYIDYALMLEDFEDNKLGAFNGDFDADLDIDSTDLNAFEACLFVVVSATPSCSAYDIDSDGYITLLDVEDILESFKHQYINPAYAISSTEGLNSTLDFDSNGIISLTEATEIVNCSEGVDWSVPAVFPDTANCLGIDLDSSGAFDDLDFLEMGTGIGTLVDAYDIDANGFLNQLDYNNGFFACFGGPAVGACAIYDDDSNGSITGLDFGAYLTYTTAVHAAVADPSIDIDVDSSGTFATADIYFSMYCLNADVSVVTECAKVDIDGDGYATTVDLQAIFDEAEKFFY